MINFLFAQSLCYFHLNQSPLKIGIFDFVEARTVVSPPQRLNTKVSKLSAMLKRQLCQKTDDNDKSI